MPPRCGAPLRGTGRPPEARARRAKARVLMIQGTASHVGKTVLVTALCRLFAREGLRVAPFKAQNISLNAIVTSEGGEMGVAQAVQAWAAGVEPSVAMNPVFLKPEPGGRAQVVLRGRLAGIRRFGAPGVPGDAPRVDSPDRRELWRAISQSLDSLRSRCDLVVIEGAGSPAEINLRRWDLANMRVARYARSPVVLVGDIDRGGVFAALVGTMALLAKDERALVRGFVINKLRGDPAGLRKGVAALEARTRRPVLGILPYTLEYRLPEEDAVALEAHPAPRSVPRGAGLDVAIVHLPYISNFDEFSPLEREPGVRVRYVRPGEALGSPDLIILPGSKATVFDLESLRRSRLAEAIDQQAASGVPVFGICGGYQMLGDRIIDLQQVESPVRAAEGLGLLPAETTIGSTKRTEQVHACVAADPWKVQGAAGGPLEVDGYQIQMGRTVAAGSPFLRIVRRGGVATDEPDGTVSADRLVWGTSVHGLFANATFRRALLEALWRRHAELGPRELQHANGGFGDHRPGEPGPASLERVLDGLADLVARHLDLDRLRRIIRLA